MRQGLVLAALLFSQPALAGDTIVAVAAFDTNTTAPELAPLGLGLSDMLLTDLSYARGVVMVEREHLKTVFAELELQQTALVDPSTAAELGRALGADLIVTGALTTHDGAMRIDARAIEVETGRVRFATEVEGRDDAFFKLEGKLARKLADGLEVSFAERVAARLDEPKATNFNAAVTYSKALSAYDAGDYATAETSARQAAAEDPKLRAAGRLALKARSRGMLGLAAAFSQQSRGVNARALAVEGHWWTTDRINLFAGTGTPWWGNMGNGDGTSTSWTMYPLYAGFRAKLYESYAEGTYLHYSPRVTLMADPGVIRGNPDRPDGWRLQPGLLVGYDIEVFLKNLPMALNMSVNVGPQPMPWHPTIHGKMTLRYNVGIVYYLVTARGR